MYSITSNIKLRFTIHMSKDGKYEAKIHVTREGESLESLFFFKIMTKNSLAGFIKIKTFSFTL
jgi:hypothetical protein